MTPVPVGSPRILAIEDDLVLGAYVHEHLGRCGFQVTWCQNGKEGLALARAQAFDVVLMDILLPGMDGLAVLTDLRTSDSTPVLLMSALGRKRTASAVFAWAPTTTCLNPSAWPSCACALKPSCGGSPWTAAMCRQPSTRKPTACGSTTNCAMYILASSGLA